MSAIIILIILLLIWYLAPTITRTLWNWFIRRAFSKQAQQMQDAYRRAYEQSANAASDEKESPLRSRPKDAGEYVEFEEIIDDSPRRTSGGSSPRSNEPRIEDATFEEFVDENK